MESEFLQAVRLLENLRKMDQELCSTLVAYVETELSTPSACDLSQLNKTLTRIRAKRDQAHSSMRELARHLQTLAPDDRKIREQVRKVLDFLDNNPPV